MKQERGGILIMVLMVLFVLLLFSLTFYYLTSSQIIMTSHQEEHNRVKIGAESAASTAIHIVRESARDNLGAFVTNWNIDYPAQPIFKHPATYPQEFVDKYMDIIEVFFEGFDNPMHTPIQITIEGYDQKEITDLDTFLVISNAPVTINGIPQSFVEDRWPSFPNDYDWEPGDITFGDGMFTFSLSIPYRIVTMAGTEETGGRYASQYNILEQGVFYQEVNRRILNRWVMCVERQRSSRSEPHLWKHTVWFTDGTNFRGPVHANDHFNILRDPFFTTLTSANVFNNSLNRDYESKFPRGYMPYTLVSHGHHWKSYSNILGNANQTNGILKDSHYSGNIPYVSDPAVPGVHDRPIAYHDSVEFPDNTEDQKLRSMHDSATEWNSSWDTLDKITINALGNNLVGGIYIPGNADYIHFSVQSTRPGEHSNIVPWRDIDGNNLETSSLHTNDDINNVNKLDNGFQMIEIKALGEITQILVQDERYNTGGIPVNRQKTYIRRRDEGGNWNNVFWEVYDGIPNGMIYVDGQLGNIQKTGQGTGLSGVISGNLKPGFTTDNQLVYTSDSRWNVTAREDIILDGNLLYSYYGNPNAPNYYGTPDQGFNSSGNPYRYGWNENMREFYNFESTLFEIGRNGRFLHQNMMGVFTANGSVWYNPVNMPSGSPGHDFYVDAFIMASQERIQVWDYENAHWGGSTGNGPVRLRGGYIQWLYGVHGRINGPGFGRNFTWDRRGEEIAPPYWPIEQRYAAPTRPYIVNQRRKPVRNDITQWPPNINQLSELFNKTYSEID